MIGNKIAKARKEISMSQAQLAQHLFTTPQAVGRGQSFDIYRIAWSTERRVVNDPAVHVVKPAGPIPQD